VNDEELLELKKPIIDACIRYANTKGWSDAMGVLRGTLFLESDPLSLDELAQKTGYSKTTVRSNMVVLENIGMVRRVVEQVGKQHRYKQHRYALEIDVEAIWPLILSAEKDETRTILQALNLAERKLDANSPERENILAILARQRQFYEEMNMIFDLMGRYTLKEIIEILKEKGK
jgi:DNA-binding transcriptional regulator GbsR (MarR family)